MKSARIVGKIAQTIKNHFEHKTAIFSFKSKNKGTFFGLAKIVKHKQMTMFKIATIIVFKSIFLLIIKE